MNTNDVGALGAMTPAPAGSALTFQRNSQWGHYARFWDTNELPCQQPPWGRLHAIDLATGDIAGRCRSVTHRSWPRAASQEQGRRALAGRLPPVRAWCSSPATNDSRIRAFDSRTGRVLWSAPLPASGHATPLLYRVPGSGQERLVIAAGGGGRFSSAVSDAVVAFGLPTAAHPDPQ